MPLGERQVEQILPVDRQRVEEDGGDGHRRGGRGHVHTRAHAPAISWNDRGRPSSSSAITSPSRMKLVCFNSFATEVSSGSRSVISSRVRV